MATTDSDPDPSRPFADRLGNADPTVAVVEAVSALTGQSVEDLPPITSAVDPEALDALCAGSSAESDLTVSFRYAGHDVTVSADESITVSPRAD